jgi:hypothetical protein
LGVRCGTSGGLPAEMAALRSQLEATILAPEALEFAVGSGVMRYAKSRPQLPTELEGLSGAALGLASEAAASEPAQVMVALVLIARGALDAAHDIVGDLDSAEATYAHAIIHRREGAASGEAGLPGYSNSRYWFSCLGDHPLFPQVNAFVAAHPAAPRALKARTDWNPAAFVECCEKSERAGSEEGLAFCVAVQQREWELLFDWCAESAGVAGGGGGAESR